MKVIPMRDYPQDVADNFLSGINFVREMRLNDPAQFALLMDRTQFIELSQEEAIINAMIAAETMEGVNGNKAYALPHKRLMRVLKKYNRLN